MAAAFTTGAPEGSLSRWFGDGRPRPAVRRPGPNPAPDGATAGRVMTPPRGFDGVSA